MINKIEYNKLCSELLPKGVKIVAVSKRQPEEKITELYGLGQRIFGENRAPELKVRHQNLPQDIEWHMVGHLQSNKIKYIAPFVSLIHSVDDLNLLQMIDKEAGKNNRIIDCLLQIFIAREETKSGFSEYEVKKLLEAKDILTLDNIRICGLMGMATFTDDEIQVGKEFRELRRLYDDLKSNYIANHTIFNILSMGMSDDYKIAIAEGTTMVRIGTLIFGERNFK
jgi:PLP dependent protein